MNAWKYFLLEIFLVLNRISHSFARFVRINYYKSKYEKVGVLPIRIIKSNVSSVDSKRQTLLSVLAVHQPFHSSICISTLPTQYITFIINILLSRLNDRITCELFFHFRITERRGNQYFPQLVFGPLLWRIIVATGVFIPC